jgi:hypothetical protein
MLHKTDYVFHLLHFYVIRLFGLGGGPNISRKEKVPCPMIPISD